MEQNRPAARLVERVPTGVPVRSRYDLALVAIPVVYLLGVFVGWLLDAVRLGVTLASVVAALAVVDVAFVDPPLGPGGRDAGGGV
ncbi:MAG: hypothetical protein ABEJ06_06190 [Haloarculaceae archaeon]